MRGVCLYCGFIQDGDTALILAVLHCHTKIVQIVLEHNADANMQCSVSLLNNMMQLYCIIFIPLLWDIILLNTVGW